MKKDNKVNKAFQKFNSLSWAVRIFLIIMFVYFLLLAAIHVVPFLVVINNSLKSASEIRDSMLALTKSWSFDNYAQMIKLFKVQGDIGFFTMLFNSLWQTFLYLFINLLSSMLLAYTLAKYRFPGKNILFGLMIFTQTIPIIGTGAAGYRLMDALNMINNPYLIWLSWAMGFDYSAFIMLGSFRTVSNSYMEAAEIDGAGPAQIFFKVMFPQIIPAVLAVLVTNFVGKWNDYSTAQIYLNKYPNLAFGAYQFEDAARRLPNAKGVYYAVLFVVALPGVLIYVFSQNFIMKNVSVGGIKG